jgi:hypothetical protein
MGICNFVEHPRLNWRKLPQENIPSVRGSAKAVPQVRARNSRGSSKLHIEATFEVDLGPILRRIPNVDQPLGLRRRGGVFEVGRSFFRSAVNPSETN